MCVLSDHQPVTHQEIERLDIGEITEGITVNTVNRKEHCAQTIISELEDRRTQINSTKTITAVVEVKNEHCTQTIISELEDLRAQITSPESNTVVVEAEIHAESTDAQHMVHFEEAHEFSDAGSLITQAPQSNPMHATINALSTWMSAIQPRESWYLSGWIRDSPIDFLVDPGVVVSAISLQCYEKLVETDAILTPMKAMQMELEAANKSDMRVHGMCNLELSVHGLLINIDAVVVDCQAILGMDILGDTSKLPFILDLVDGTLSGGGYETIQLHRFHAATECFAETTDPVCIPPHSEVMLWAKLKTNNGRRGPTAGVVLALQTFVQEFGLLIGRSLVHADAEDWKISILIYNSDPCSTKSTDCTCNPVIIPGHTRIARVEEIQAIQHIGTRETERGAGECALPPHLIYVLDAATDLASDQRARAADLLAKHIKTFPAPMKAMQMELEAANKSDMRVHGMCNLELSVHGLLINIDAVVVNCQAILGMDILGDASKLPFILDLVDGTLSGGGYETIQLHRFHAATECFAETTDPVCIPPHSEVMLWAKLKTNNGRRGPTAGVVLALQTFVQEFGLLVGRSLVHADAEDWKISILIYNSDPCSTKSTDCTCNPVIIPGHTRIARVEEIQAIQHIGTRETERGAGECALPPHLIDVLDAATDLTSDQRARAADLLAKHIKTFPAPGTPITGRTEAVMHEIDTGSTRPIRCNPRKLSPKKIKIQQELVDKMLEEGQIEHSVSAWSAPTVLVTKKDGTTRFCVDYRRLNNSTKKYAFPLPRIDDSLNSLSGQAWFSTLDLASGYWQVRLSEDAKPKTAFSTHSGLFQFNVMPFGLCNAHANLSAS